MAMNGGDQGVKLIVVATVFLALSILAAALRLWARRLTRTKLQLNDWLLLVATTFLIGQTLIADLLAAYGDIALPKGTASKDTARYTSNVEFPGSILWGLSLLFIKLSVLHFYYLMFPVRRFRIICMVVMAIVLVYFIAYVFVIILECTPIEKDWDKTIHGVCVNSATRTVVTAAVNLGIDLLVVILPMPVVWRLQTTVSKRLLISAIFAAGLLVCVTSGLHIYFWSLTDVPDQVNHYLTSVLEPQLGIITACLPFMKPAVSQLAQPIQRLRLKSRASSQAPIEKSPTSSQRKILHQLSGSAFTNTRVSEQSNDHA